MREDQKIRRISAISCSENTYLPRGALIRLGHFLDLLCGTSIAVTVFQWTGVRGFLLLSTTRRYLRPECRPSVVDSAGARRRGEGRRPAYLAKKISRNSLINFLNSSSVGLSIKMTLLVTCSGLRMAG